MLTFAMLSVLVYIHDDALSQDVAPSQGSDTEKFTKAMEDIF